MSLCRADGCAGQPGQSCGFVNFAFRQTCKDCGSVRILPVEEPARRSVRSSSARPMAEKRKREPEARAEIAVPAPATAAPAAATRAMASTTATTAATIVATTAATRARATAAAPRRRRRRRPRTARARVPGRRGRGPMPPVRLRPMLSCVSATSRTRPRCKTTSVRVLSCCLHGTQGRKRRRSSARRRGRTLQ